MIADRYKGPFETRVQACAGSIYNAALLDATGHVVAIFMYPEDAREIREYLNKPRDEITVSLT